MKNREKEYRVVLDESRRRLNLLIDRRGAKPIKVLYDRAMAEQIKKIKTQLRASSFSAYQQATVLAQLRQGQLVLSRRLVGELGKLSEEALKESLNGLQSALDRLEPDFEGASVGIRSDIAARFEGIIDNRAPTMLRIHEQSVARYGSAVVDKMGSELAQSAMLVETPIQAMARIESVADTSWYGAERIVRTESAYAYNLAHRDGISEASEEIEDLMMQWNEHCTPEGIPLDDRVSVDSLAMHGQVAAPDGVFVCPSTSPSPDAKGKIIVPPRLAQEEFRQPPNRPNDRSVLTPWRRVWGLPGWIWNGRRTWFNR